MRLYKFTWYDPKATGQRFTYWHTTQSDAAYWGLVLVGNELGLSDAQRTVLRQGVVQPIDVPTDDPAKLAAWLNDQMKS